MRLACAAKSRSKICPRLAQICWQLIHRVSSGVRRTSSFACRLDLRSICTPAGFATRDFSLLRRTETSFVTESHANQIKVLRDSKNTGKADVTEVFAERDLNKPFGIAFYPPGNDPQFLYVANTDGVIRFPYRNGDLKARGPAEKTGAKLSGGAAFLRSGGHWTRDLIFSPDGKKMYVSIGSRSNDSDNAAEADRARIFEFNPDGSGQKVYA